MSNNSHVTDTNVGEMNYEIEVKKLYPDAIFWALSHGYKIGAIFPCLNSNSKLSEYTTEAKAWKSAYQNLKK